MNSRRSQGRQLHEYGCSQLPKRPSLSTKTPITAIPTAAAKTDCLYSARRTCVITAPIITMARTEQAISAISGSSIREAAAKAKAAMSSTAPIPLIANAESRWPTPRHWPPRVRISTELPSSLPLDEEHCDRQGINNRDHLARTSPTRYGPGSLRDVVSGSNGKIRQFNGA